MAALAKDKYGSDCSPSVAAVALKEHFGWSQTEKGLVLSALIAGYMSCMFRKQPFSSWGRLRPILYELSHVRPP
jgi:hypothetical protein